MRALFDPRLFGAAFVTLFVIMDPPGTVPLFLALTTGRSPQARRRAAWQAVLVAFTVIVVFALFGQQLLDYLGIGIPALQGAGGLLLVLVALELLTGQSEPPRQVEDVNVALVPLGTPLLAGPGAIVAPSSSSGGRSRPGSTSPWPPPSSPFTSSSTCSCGSPGW